MKTDDDREGVGRRTFFYECAANALALVPATALLSCNKGLSCNDVAGLSPDDQQLRMTNKYQDQSTDPAKHCDNCMQFEAAGPDKCGSCKVLKGPINPNGFCGLWTMKS